MESLETSEFFDMFPDSRSRELFEKLQNVTDLTLNFKEIKVFLESVQMTTEVSGQSIKSFNYHT